MSLWGRIFAAGYDRFMAATEKAGLSQHRAELLAKVNRPTVDMMRSVGLSVTDLRRGELPKACRS